MGKIHAGLFISLDGVIESPEKWHFQYFNDEMGAAVGAMMANNDAMLLGRQTYQEFAAYWPNADPNDPTTAQMNGAQKYVVSSTLDKAEWENSTVVGGDIYGQLRELKATKSLGITGSATLVSSLLRDGLLDELHLMVHPIIVGAGKRLFNDGPTVGLRLVDEVRFSTGVLHLTYAPANA